MLSYDDESWDGEDVAMDQAFEGQHGMIQQRLDVLQRQNEDLEQAREKLERALIEAQQQHAEMRWLFEASQAVLDCHTFVEAAQRIFEAARRATGAVSGYVALLNEETGENDVLFLESGGLPCEVDPDLPMPVRGLRAEAYADAAVVYDNDFERSRWIAFIPEGHVALHNVLFAPLTLDEKVVGVIGLANKPGGFTAYDARTAKHFGDMAAIALSRIRTEEVVQRYAADLRESNRDLKRFADALSHDLREPVRMVEIFLELLQKECGGQLDDRARQFLDYAVESAGRTRAMVGGLLDLSRVQSRGRALAEVDTGKVLDLTLLALTGMIHERGAEVTRDPLPRVRADAAQLGQVFQNLIANGIKFQKDGVPRVHVSARRLSPSAEEDQEAHGIWCFSVQDNGVGFDSGEAGHIFEIFKRLHTEDEYPGLGIGLALCKRIVERHGGRIWAESEPGAGATFFFTLPAVRDDSACRDRDGTLE